MSTTTLDVHREYADRDPDLTFSVVEPDAPYGTIPAVPAGGCMLAWYVCQAGDNGYDGRQILLSDLCKGEPSTEQVVKFVSHEYLHDILEDVEDLDTSRKLDNLVDGADFIADREENGIDDDRELKDRYKLISRLR